MPNIQSCDRKTAITKNFLLFIGSFIIFFFFTRNCLLALTTGLQMLIYSTLMKWNKGRVSL